MRCNSHVRSYYGAMIICLQLLIISDNGILGTSSTTRNHNGKTSFAYSALMVVSSESGWCQKCKLYRGLKKWRREWMVGMIRLFQVFFLRNWRFLNRFDSDLMTFFVQNDLVTPEGSRSQDFLRNFLRLSETHSKPFCFEEFFLPKRLWMLEIPTWNTTWVFDEG